MKYSEESTFGMVIFCMLIWVIMGDALACGMINGFPSRYKVISHPQRQELLQGEHEEAVEASWKAELSLYLGKLRISCDIHARTFFLQN